MYVYLSVQYGQAYGYQSNQQQQQNVSLPGQLQSPPQTLQPSLPGQSAQLHVTHITPPGGVQTVHQTQVSNFGQTGTGVQQVTNSNREYVGPTTAAMTTQSLHPSILQNSITNQVILGT